MKQNVNLVTLGVADAQASAAFYERLGWRRSSASVESTVFFDAGGIVLALWSRQSLAADAGATPDGSGFRAVALAVNVHSPQDVDATLERARSAGAVLTRPAGPTDWGGYTGYFSDPDGHLWEVAFNPYWPLDADGRVVLPD